MLNGDIQESHQGYFTSGEDGTYISIYPMLANHEASYHVHSPGARGK
jgi:hypothetical protein